MDKLVPNIDWYKSISKEHGLPPRCPFASAERCPRYYQSLSSLGNAGSTSIPESLERKYLQKWKNSDLWPTVREQETSLSGPDGKTNSYSNFCPEVSYDRFGLFATCLYRHKNEADGGIAERYLRQEYFPDNHWGWSWMHVEKCHYTDCPIYSPLSSTANIPKNQESKTERILLLLKNHRILSFFIVVGIIIIALGSVTDALDSIQKWFAKLFNNQ